MPSHQSLQDSSIREPLYQTHGTSPAWFVPDDLWLWPYPSEDASSQIPLSQVLPTQLETSLAPFPAPHEEQYSVQASQQTSPASTEDNFKPESNIGFYRQERRRAQCRKSQRSHRAKKKRELEQMQETLRQTEARVERLRNENRQLLELFRLLKERRRLFEEQKSRKAGP